jgi:hypothetical protein
MLKISKEEQLTGYVPTPGLVEAAHERTQSMVSYYREAVRHADWRQEWDFLERLAQSCYLQGAQDAANVAAQMQILKPQP